MKVKPKLKHFRQAFSTAKIWGVSLRDLPTLIGNSVASLFAVKYGPLYYRYIEKDETVGLKYHQGNFQGEIILSSNVKEDNQWWSHHIDNAFYKSTTPKQGILT